MVNGRKMDIASYRVNPGDVVSLRTKSQNLEIVEDSLAGVYQRPEWMEFDDSKRAATVKTFLLPSKFFPIEIRSSSNTTRKACSSDFQSSTTPGWFLLRLGLLCVFRPVF